MDGVRKILVPVDFSSCSQAALDYAAYFAGSVHASIDVLHVWSRHSEVPTLTWQPGANDDLLLEFARSDAGLAMQVCLESVEEAGVEARGLFEISDDPAAAILEVAAREYDLVVLGTHGELRLPESLLGSVAEEVVRRAPCPVVTLSEAHGVAHVRPSGVNQCETRR